MRYAAALIAALVMVAGVEWSTDEDLITMFTLIIASTALGCLRPRLFAVSGLLVGLVVPAVAVFSQIAGVRPAYESAAEAASHGVRYEASLLILVLPALVGAFIGRLAVNNARALQT